MLCPWIPLGDFCPPEPLFWPGCAPGLQWLSKRSPHQYASRLTVGDVVETETVSLVGRIGDKANVEISRRCRNSRRHILAAVLANQPLAGRLAVAHLSTAATSDD